MRRTATRSANSFRRRAPDDGRDFIEVFRYPSEREQLVEQVIRRLAMERSRLALVGDGHDRVLLQFSLHEVRRELRAVNHGLDGNEVREALTILARSRIIISKV